MWPKGLAEACRTNRLCSVQSEKEKGETQRTTSSLGRAFVKENTATLRAKRKDTVLIPFQVVHDVCGRQRVKGAATRVQQQRLHARAAWSA